jgi:hypothetical protein
MRLANK